MMRGKLRLVTLLVCLCSTSRLFASPDPMRERAQVLLDEGNAALNSGQYVEALAKFREAHSVFPSPKLLLNIGTTLRQLGRNAEAATVYEQYLAHPERDPARVPELEALIAQIDQTVAVVVIQCRTVGAVVRVDGQIVGLGPMNKRMRVEPGDHTVLSAKAGLRDGVATLRLGPREQRSVAIEPAAQAVVRQVAGSTGDTQRVAGFVVAGVGLLGLIGGAITGGLAVAREDEASDHCSTDDEAVCDADAVSLTAEATNFGTAATVLLVVGGVTAGAGIVIALTAPRDESTVGRSGPASPALPGGLALHLGIASAMLEASW